MSQVGRSDFRDYSQVVENPLNSNTASSVNDLRARVLSLMNNTTYGRDSEVNNGYCNTGQHFQSSPSCLKRKRQPEVYSDAFKKNPFSFNTSTNIVHNTDQQFRGIVQQQIPFQPKALHQPQVPIQPQASYQTQAPIQSHAAYTSKPVSYLKWRDIEGKKILLLPWNDKNFFYFVDKLARDPNLIKDKWETIRQSIPKYLAKYLYFDCKLEDIAQAYCIAKMYKRYSESVYHSNNGEYDTDHQYSEYVEPSVPLGYVNHSNNEEHEIGQQFRKYVEPPASLGYVNRSNNEEHEIGQQFREYVEPPAPLGYINHSNNEEHEIGQQFTEYVHLNVPSNPSLRQDLQCISEVSSLHSSKRKRQHNTPDLQWSSCKAGYRDLPWKDPEFSQYVKKLAESKKFIHMPFNSPEKWEKIREKIAKRYRCKPEDIAKGTTILRKFAKFESQRIPLDQFVGKFNKHRSNSDNYFLYQSQVPIQPQASYQPQVQIQLQAPSQPQASYRPQTSYQPQVTQRRQVSYQPQVPIQSQAPSQPQASYQPQTSYQSQAPIQSQAAYTSKPVTRLRWRVKGGKKILLLPWSDKNFFYFVDKLARDPNLIDNKWETIRQSIAKYFDCKPEDLAKAYCIAGIYTKYSESVYHSNNEEYAQSPASLGYVNHSNNEEHEIGQQFTKYVQPSRRQQALYQLQEPIQPQAPHRQQVPIQPQVSIQPQTSYQPQVPIQPQAPHQPLVPIRPKAPYQQQVPIQPQSDISKVSSPGLKRKRQPKAYSDTFKKNLYSFGKSTNVKHNTRQQSKEDVQLQIRSDSNNDSNNNEYNTDLYNTDLQVMESEHIEDAQLQTLSFSLNNPNNEKHKTDQEFMEDVQPQTPSDFLSDFFNDSNNNEYNTDLQVMESEHIEDVQLQTLSFSLNNPNNEKHKTDQEFMEDVQPQTPSDFLSDFFNVSNNNEYNPDQQVMECEHTETVQQQVLSGSLDNFNNGEHNTDQQPTENVQLRTPIDSPKDFNDCTHNSDQQVTEGEHMETVQQQVLSGSLDNLDIGEHNTDQQPTENVLQRTPVDSPKDFNDSAHNSDQQVKECEHMETVQQQVLSGSLDNSDNEEHNTDQQPTENALLRTPLDSPNDSNNSAHNPDQQVMESEHTETVQPQIPSGSLDNSDNGEHDTDQWPTEKVQLRTPTDSPKDSNSTHNSDQQVKECEHMETVQQQVLSGSLVNSDNEEHNTDQQPTENMLLRTPVDSPKDFNDSAHNLDQQVKECEHTETVQQQVLSGSLDNSNNEEHNTDQQPTEMVQLRTPIDSPKDFNDSTHNSDQQVTECEHRETVQQQVLSGSLDNSDNEEHNTDQQPMEDVELQTRLVLSPEEELLDATHFKKITRGNKELVLLSWRDKKFFDFVDKLAKDPNLDNLSIFDKGKTIREEIAKLLECDVNKLANVYKIYYAYTSTADLYKKDPNLFSKSNNREDDEQFTVKPKIPSDPFPGQELDTMRLRKRKRGNKELVYLPWRNKKFFDFVDGLAKDPNLNIPDIWKTIKQNKWKTIRQKIAERFNCDVKNLANEDSIFASYLNAASTHNKHNTDQQVMVNVQQPTPSDCLNSNNGESNTDQITESVQSTSSPGQELPTSKAVACSKKSKMRLPWSDEEFFNFVDKLAKDPNLANLNTSNKWETIRCKIAKYLMCDVENLARGCSIFISYKNNRDLYKKDSNSSNNSNNGKQNIAQPTSSSDQELDATPIKKRKRGNEELTLLPWKDKKFFDFVDVLVKDPSLDTSDKWKTIRQKIAEYLHCDVQNLSNEYCIYISYMRTASNNSEPNTDQQVTGNVQPQIPSASALRQELPTSKAVARSKKRKERLPWRDKEFFDFVDGLAKNSKDFKRDVPQKWEAIRKEIAKRLNRKVENLPKAHTIKVSYMRLATSISNP